MSASARSTGCDLSGLILPASPRRGHSANATPRCTHPALLHCHLAPPRCAASPPPAAGELAAPPDQNGRQLSELASRSLKMRELWVIPYQELTLLKEIGTGSFGEFFGREGVGREGEGMEREGMMCTRGS